MASLYLSLFFFVSIISSTFGVIDVVVQDLGCWKESPEKNLIRSWEGKDDSLDGPYKTRFDALQKCARVTQKLGLRYFALRDGGLCATGRLVEVNYTDIGMSEDCSIDGRGGIWANQVYMINTIWDAQYVPLGWWREDIVEELELLEGRFIRLMDDQSIRENAEEKCARAAASVKRVIFALGIDGSCFIWSRPKKELNWYARSSDIDWREPAIAKGIRVYHITSRRNITLVNLGCWKTNEIDRTLPLMESSADILGTHDYTVRPDAVERCAIYSTIWHHGLFAVTDGGACAGSDWTDVRYDDLGPSIECEVNGKGAATANQVYKIITEVRNVTWESDEPYFPFHLNHLGCWRDGDTSLIPSLEEADIHLVDLPEDRVDPAFQCAKAAWRRGFDVFVLKEGRCYSSRKVRSLFQTFGPSKDCVDDLGSADSFSVYEINRVIDPWHTNVGCFEKCDKEVPLVALEGLVPWLEDSPRKRKDRIRKCSLAATSLNYTHFALMDSGHCYAVREKSLRDCVMSASCYDDGEGGRFAIQLYKIRARNNFTVENLGCWKDDAFRLIPTAEGSTAELSGRWTNREDAIGACARYARSRGFRVFALQSGGMCLTSERAEERYNWYGWSNKCEKDGKGGEWSNQVWRINEDWWDAPATWWIVPEPWKRLGEWNCTWQWWKTPELSWN